MIAFAIQFVDGEFFTYIGEIILDHENKETDFRVLVVSPAHLTNDSAWEWGIEGVRNRIWESAPASVALN